MKTIQELQAIREAMKAKIANRATANDTDIRVVVGMATCGIAAGARGVLTAFMTEIEKRHLINVKVSQTGCIGMCANEPIVEVYMPGKEKVTYIKMDPERVNAVISSHIVNGNIVKEYTFGYKEKDGGEQ